MGEIKFDDNSQGARKKTTMRKQKLQVQMAADEYIAGANGEMDWMIFNWDTELNQYVSEITAPVDCIVLGRKLAQGFIPHWAAHPEEDGAVKINNPPKVVFTKNLDKSEWAIQGIRLWDCPALL